MDVVRPVRELIERRLPGCEGWFALYEIDACEGFEVFEAEAEGERVALRGSSPVALASALNWYVKYVLKGSFSWCGDQIPRPERAPLPKEKHRQVIRQRRRVYMNYCTHSYSAAWWDWERWALEIDRMALHGINMPLSVVGAEMAWYDTLIEFGYSDEAARGFLCGPAYLAWFLMGNLQSFGGPMPLAYWERRARMGRKIIERELEFGMCPIQQGFSGFVPADLGEHFPQAAIGIKPKWCAFPETAQLDPTDPLFARMAGAFYRHQTRRFGAHGYYAVDPFHESEPPEDSESYLNAVGRALSDTIRAFDPHGVAVMQSWSIRRDVLRGMDGVGVLILDYNGGFARKENWWGLPFVIGNLHNFGGRINLHGDAKMLADNLYERVREQADNVCGSGMFMEGIGQNPLYYDLAFEMGIREGKLDLDDWLRGYARRRYGAKSEAAERAVALLAEAAYCPGSNNVENSSMICARPALEAKKSGPNAGFHIPYAPEKLQEALKLLLEDAPKLAASDAYRFDVMDVGRQTLSNLLQPAQGRVTQAFLDGDAQAFARESERFLGILDDADALLATREEFSFKRWMRDAMACGETNEERALCARNAATLVTIWGPEEPVIFDYAWREWAYLISMFYRERWSRFFAMLAEKLRRGETYSEDDLPQVYGRETFRANAFYGELADFELRFAEGDLTFEERAPEDTVALGKALVEKYGF